MFRTKYQNSELHARHSTWQEGDFMTYLEQIQRGVDFIEENLRADINITDVAKHAGMSRWHFQRMFKGLTGETVKMYIRTRRLGKSLEDLRSTDARILDIALRAGFESQESYTRAFKKAFNTTPAHYRESGEKYPFTKIRFDSDYLEHLNQGVSLTPEIDQQRQMTLVGLRTTFYSTDSDKNNVSDKLPPLWQAFLSRLAEIKNTTGEFCYGVVRQLEDASDELEYYCAIEVTNTDEIPQGMQAVTIEPATYAKFTHRGSVSKIDNTINYIYSTWLAQSSHQHTYQADLEFYGADYSPVSEQSVMHYAIPIKPMLPGE